VMREIVAYAPVEPDGSVRMKVPANVAFQISLLDADGRRVSPIHRSWLSVRPGEVLACNGCHTRTATQTSPGLVHGRKGLFNSAYAGATATGAAFPGAVNTISPESGDTMARARGRGGSSCIDPVTMIERCGRNSIIPSANVVYDEIWKPAAAPTDSFAYTYQLLTTASPANVNCFPVWTPTCRITIHYATIGARAGQIHPLWSVPRPAAGVDDGTGNLIYPQTCTYCHSRTNPMDPAMPQLPAASLELTDEVSDEDALQLRAYRELLFTRNELELDAMGAVQVRLVPGPPDANGNPTQVPVPLAPSMQALNARGSTAFFNRFRPGGSHANYLTTAELRLLSEWLDIGAQYYNDPFPPTPQN
jgi:hydrazine synthase alpha subunit-like protein